MAEGLDLYGGHNLYCTHCTRLVPTRCTSCGYFIPAKKPSPESLCIGCGQIKTTRQREQSSDEELDEEEEEYIKQKGDVLRRKCSCCNRAIDSCTKCKRAYLSDSDEEDETDVEADSEGEDKDEKSDNEAEVESDEGDSEDEDEPTPTKKQKKPKKQKK